jgi:hypothetical protein
MVNVGFPAPAFYGFEMVDAPGAVILRHHPPSIENLHRIKINRIFLEFPAI